jgi:hypothetical protein
MHMPVIMIMTVIVFFGSHASLLLS